MPAKLRHRLLAGPSPGWLRVAAGTRCWLISDRTRFIALSGVILAAFSIVLMLALWLPMIVFNPCQR